MAPKLSRLAARTMPSAGHACLTVLGNSPARLRARLTKPCEINATVTEPRPSGSVFRQESPKRLSTLDGGDARSGFRSLSLLPTTSRIALCHREIRKGAALTRGRPDGKALRSASSSAAGPQNPAAGDTGSRSPSEGLTDDSLRSPGR